MKPHKHAALIHAWADGAEIEKLSRISELWIDVKEPGWEDYLHFRVKPVPKPDYCKFTQVTHSGVGELSLRKWSRDNLKLTFCGETGALKDAEVLK